MLFRIASNRIATEREWAAFPKTASTVALTRELGKVDGAVFRASMTAKTADGRA